MTNKELFKIIRKLTRRKLAATKRKVYFLDNSLPAWALTYGNKVDQLDTEIIHYYNKLS